MTSESDIARDEATNPTRDPDYYLATVVFQVENSIFNVPRFQFERSSEIFATTFTLPPADGTKPEGSSPHNPFKLEGISSADFRALLKLLYPLTCLPKTPTLTKDEWMSVLKLATLYRFLELRELAIQELATHAQSLDCMQRVALGKQYDVAAWIRSGYTDLARRDAPISLEESSTIGWELTLRIYQAREVALRTGYSRYSVPNVQNVDVEALFQKEFRAADSASAAYKFVEPNPLAPTMIGIQMQTSILGAGRSRWAGFQYPDFAPPT
ncbi:hypothetical protein B0H17DRAFT_1021590 [Mycena rosella]|uniref:BTB domain-containing protein n=1 Tax=Mycena rosella TaxID=1033263 RepID=A0AAD7CNS5_MYCRO|nr:hypothetical protein B0H17DRAFT_1021590 [Mycena rosella]